MLATLRARQVALPIHTYTHTILYIYIYICVCVWYIYIYGCALCPPFFPVSYLPFASKLLEKVVAAGLAENLTTYNLKGPFQSAYRPHHSVESAIIRVQSDILQAMDSQRVVVLVMLVSGVRHHWPSGVAANASPVTWVSAEMGSVGFRATLLAGHNLSPSTALDPGCGFRVLVSLRAQS